MLNKNGSRACLSGLVNGHTPNMDTANILTGLAADSYRNVSSDERSWLIEQTNDHGPVLTWIEDGVPRAYKLGPLTRIGSSRNAEIRLEHPSVVRAHAILAQRDGRWLLSGQRTVSGIFVNGELVDQAWLDPGDIIQIGAIQLHFLIVD
jgi:hypothetical protein